MRALVIATVLALTTSAAADPIPAPGRVPHLIMREPRVLCKPDTDPPVCRTVPAGRYLDEPAWQTLDTEVRRLQAAETRLTAENKSLRGAVSGWQPGWKMLLVAFLAGATAAVVGYAYLH